MNPVVPNHGVSQWPTLPGDKVAGLVEPVATVARVPVVDDNPEGDTTRLNQLADGARRRIEAQRLSKDWDDDFITDIKDGT